MTQPLTCQFGGLTIAITCSDTAVAHTLYHHFQHCLSHTSFPLAHYHIQQADPYWQLHVDQTLLQTAATPLALFEPLMQAALQRLIEPQQQHLIFHAGAVAYAAQGVMVCGATGAGKSSLVAQLIAAGLDYLTDEVVALSLEPGPMTGFARSLVLKAGSEFLWQRAPANDDLLLLPDGLAWVAPAFLGEVCVRHKATTTLLLFPHYEADSLFAARPFTPAESAFHLLQHLVNARNLPQHGLPTITNLAHNIPAFALQYSDGLEVAAWLRQQLGT